MLKKQRLPNIIELYLLIAILFSIMGCSQNKWDVNVDDIKIDQEFKPFHQDLFSVPIDSIWDYVPYLQDKYGNFFEVFNSHIIKIGGTNQLDYDTKLAYFLTDPDIVGTKLMIDKTIDLKKMYKVIENGFKHYHYYFPDRYIPDIYTHISGFNQSIIIDTNYISISLDKYLGQNSKYYQMLRTPMYKRLNMHAHKIPSDVFLTWGETEFLFNNKTENLINKMIYYGKLHTLLDAVLPNEPDTLKWGFTNNQINWCHKSEKQMWVYIVENKLLFSTEFKDLNKYLNDGPFTSTFSKESPARVGRWIGYQIIQSYLKANPEISLTEIMSNSNYQQILNESKYKP